MSAELLDLSAASAAAAIRAGEVDAHELFELYRARAAAEDLNAFLWLAEAPPADRLSVDAPLAGVPLAVKDLFCTEGIPSQSGSKILEGYRPPYTATVVRQLIEAGAPGGDGPGEAGARGEAIRDTSEHLRLKLSQWCENAVKRTTEDMESLEMHSAVRNVMRLFDRIKDFEKRVLAREGQLSGTNHEALVEALGLLARMLGPLAPHMAEELWIACGGEEHGAQTPWPGVSFEVPA